ncbi:MAG: methylaspartate ammonia-lyase [Sedimentisphaerales bacterium]|nr:methylaspartate ammonia-lyase [Sedimentisphaerales bacterium]
MNIKKVLFSTGYTGFFSDDQAAIKSGLKQDGFFYQGGAVTAGFKQVRQAGESISVLLVLENGQTAVGDCAAVQYSGAGGRDPLFTAHSYISVLEKYVRPMLECASVNCFRELADRIDRVLVEGRQLHTALRYGITQAILDAVAKAHQKTMTEIIWQEYNLPSIIKPVPLFGQSGDDRYLAADKMILKQVDVLPHALINNIESKLGMDGKKLKDYIIWLRERILHNRFSSSYHPTLHIDVYGTIGMIFNYDISRIATYLAELEKAARPFDLYIEGPVDVGHKQRQIDMLLKIRKELDNIGCKVKIVADEWCNTYEDVRDFSDSRCCHMVQIKTPDLGGIQHIVESVLYAKRHGMEAYQGGTCNETDISAKICVHLALAAGADRMLAKPGMGFDEGFCIVKNEMERTLKLLSLKYGNE